MAATSLFHAPEFRLSSRRLDTAVVVEVHGELDHLSADYLLEAVADLLAGGDVRAVVLDLHRCDFLDSGGVTALLGLAALLANGSLVLAAPSDPVRRVLDCIDIGDAAASHPSVDTALAEVRDEPAVEVAG